MRILRYLSLAAVAVMVLAAAAPAGASIVPQQGMLGVKIGMSAPQITARLGPPDSVRHPRNEIIGRYTEYRYGEVRVSLFESNSQVFNFFTKGRSARTTKGVGVGSPEAYVKSAVAGVSCKSEFGTRHCIVGQQLAGRIVTDFRIIGGRVANVTVGRVID
jgi:hypothetical protein